MQKIHSEGDRVCVTVCCGWGEMEADDPLCCSLKREAKRRGEKRDALSKKVPSVAKNLLSQTDVSPQQS